MGWRKQSAKDSGPLNFISTRRHASAECCRLESQLSRESVGSDSNGRTAAWGAAHNDSLSASRLLHESRSGRHEACMPVSSLACRKLERELALSCQVWLTKVAVVAPRMDGLICADRSRFTRG
jgi:hypothetical protein